MADHLHTNLRLGFHVTSEKNITSIKARGILTSVPNTYFILDRDVSVDTIHEAMRSLDKLGSNALTDNQFFERILRSIGAGRKARVKDPALIILDRHIAQTDTRTTEKRGKGFLGDPDWYLDEGGLFQYDPTQERRPYFHRMGAIPLSAIIGIIALSKKERGLTSEKKNEALRLKLLKFIARKFPPT